MTCLQSHRKEIMVQDLEAGSQQPESLHEAGLSHILTGLPWLPELHGAELQDGYQCPKQTPVKSLHPSAFSSTSKQAELSCPIPGCLPLTKLGAGGQFTVLRLETNCV